MHPKGSWMVWRKRNPQLIRESLLKDKSILSGKKRVPSYVYVCIISMIWSKSWMIELKISVYMGTKYNDPIMTCVYQVFDHIKSFQHAKNCLVFQKRFSSWRSPLILKVLYSVSLPLRFLFILFFGRGCRCIVIFFSLWTFTAWCFCFGGNFS